MKKNKHRGHHNKPASSANNPAPASQPIPKNNTPNPHDCPDKCEHDETSKNKLDRGMLNWTRVVGAFTAVLAIVGSLQLLAFVQSERAFLSIENFQIEGTLTEGKKLSFLYELKNSGRSPAIITDTKINIMPTLSPNPIYQGESKTSFNIVAGGSSIKGFHEPLGSDFSPIIISPQQYSDFQGGRAKMFVFGYLTFEDDFSILMGTRTVGFCFLYLPERSPPGGSAFGGCPNPKYTYVK